MWKIRRRCSLVALPPKLSSTKTIWLVMQAQRFSVCRTCSFFSLPTCLWKILFSGEIPWIIFLMQFHTHHSLDFIRRQKMFKITGYIHLYYKIPFLSGVARILVTFSFFLFIIHREFCFNIFSVWYKAATHVSWEVLWTKGTSPRPS